MLGDTGRMGGQRETSVGHTGRGFAEVTDWLRHLRHIQEEGSRFRLLFVCGWFSRATQLSCMTPLPCKKI